MESDAINRSRSKQPDARDQFLAWTYRLSAAVIGVLVLIVLVVNSQAANVGTEGMVAAIVGFIPMLGVAHALRRGLPWGRYAALALPLCQAVGLSAVLLGGGPMSALSGLALFVRNVIAVQLLQCPVTAVLAIVVLRRSA